MITLETYVEELYQLNKGHLDNYTNQTFNALVWGLVEEHEEFKQALDSSDLIVIGKEAGDVLAYYTLILLCIYAKDRCEVIKQLVFVIYGEIHTSVDYLSIFSNMKRFNREGEELNLEQFGIILSSTLCVCQHLGIYIETIAYTNNLKLKARHLKGTLLKGSGEHR